MPKSTNSTSCSRRHPRTPTRRRPSPEAEADDAKVLEVVGKLSTEGHQVSLRAVRATVTGLRGIRVDDALTRLVPVGNHTNTQAPEVPASSPCPKIKPRSVP